MTMTCIDIGSRHAGSVDGLYAKGLRIGMALGDEVMWDGDADAERIRGVDLSDIARQSARLRDERPDIDVVADIDVYIAAESDTVRAMLNASRDEIRCGNFRYIGTPSGLASLIADIHAVGIVDGAVLIPRAAGVADLICDIVLPALRTTLESPAPTREARSA